MVWFSQRNPKYFRCKYRKWSGPRSARGVKPTRQDSCSAHFVDWDHCGGAAPERAEHSPWARASYSLVSRLSGHLGPSQSLSGSLSTGISLCQSKFNWLTLLSWALCFDVKLRKVYDISVLSESRFFYDEIQILAWPSHDIFAWSAEVAETVFTLLLILYHRAPPRHGVLWQVSSEIERINVSIKSIVKFFFHSSK